MARRSAIPGLCAAALLATGTAGMAQAQGFDIRSLFQGPTTTGTASPPEESPAPPTGPGMERRVRRVRPSDHDLGGDPRRRGEFSRLSRRAVAARRPAQRAARHVRRPDRRPDAGPADHGPDGFASPNSPSRSGTISISWSARRGSPTAARSWRSTRRRSTRSRRPTASTGISSPRSGASSSNYGTQIGDRSVIRSTATLACIGRRQNYFRDEFLSALEILARGDVTADHLKGSWAGAFGPTQFMPTSFKRFAVDFDGDGRRDVVELDPGPDRLDGQQSEEGRLGPRRRPGATRWWCRRGSTSCWPTARA